MEIGLTSRMAVQSPWADGTVLAGSPVEPSSKLELPDSVSVVPLL